ncbi:hypothetical protein D9X91_11710 [Falsibacillus albus]|uniref:Uncharacterized protein n=1 Tax=Falsibacillus albus TaxID=2478915 RepID=A0A3L7JWN2_9BACI|nr:hypothetical protein [Falsibacillus albus]RLQ95156.1 hypothetical protein D9X91_11710 [Falsibacillus albus]
MIKNPFHACATCIHFEARKYAPRRMKYRCTRLNYETKPDYQFNCWEPKTHVVDLMKKREMGK